MKVENVSGLMPPLSPWGQRLCVLCGMERAGAMPGTSYVPVSVN